jgi:hypothetical protein
MKNEQLEPDLTLYHASNAHQSNFRTISLVMELGNRFLQLRDATAGGYQKDVDSLSHKVLEVLMQCNYTSKCLGGALKPNASVPTDQREVTREIMSHLAQVAAVLDRQPNKIG